MGIEATPANTADRFCTLCLLVGLVAYVFIWLLCPQEFSASDPGAYAKAAFTFSQGNGFGEGSVFEQRLAVTLPTALFYKALGVHIRTTNLLPLVCALLIVVTVYAALPDPRSKLAGLVLCLVSFPLFQASVRLYPDLVAAAFMAMSYLLLLSRTMVREKWPFSAWNPVAAVGFLFVAFLAKLSAYWVLPLWVGAFAVDLRSSGGTDLLRRFYVPALVTGLGLAIAYFVFSYEAWGDPLARLKAVEAVSGQHLWSRTDATSLDVARRLTVSPLKALFDGYGPGIILLAILGIGIASGSLRGWGAYAVSCLVFLWFGPTSLTRYEPMPLELRHTLPILPPLYVLAAFAASRLTIASDRGHRMQRLLPFGLILFLAGWPLAKDMYSWPGKELAEAEAMKVIRQAATERPGVRHLLVSSDRRSAESLAFYFGFQYPENLEVLYAGRLLPRHMLGRRTFVFINRWRSRKLERLYGFRHFDDELESLGLPIVYESGDVSLLEVPPRDELRQLLFDKVHRMRAAESSAVARSRGPDVEWRPGGVGAPPEVRGEGGGRGDVRLPQ